MMNFTEKMRVNYPYLHNVRIDQELDEIANSTVTISGDMSNKLIVILNRLSGGVKRWMSVSFKILGNRVTFSSSCLNDMYPLLDTLKNTLYKEIGKRMLKSLLQAFFYYVL